VGTSQRRANSPGVTSGTRFLSIFADGLEEIVQQVVESTLPDVTVELCRSGSIVFSSRQDQVKVAALPFFRNTFRLLRLVQTRTGTSSATVLAMLAKDRETLDAIRLAGQRLHGVFRVIVADGSSLISVDAHLMEAMEQAIRLATRLRVDRSKPDHEFWLHGRSDGTMFFSLRITRTRASEHLLQKGELRPEIVDILCRLSEPKSGELFLDPFAGSGAIPLARASHFPACTVLANDADEERISQIKSRVSNLSRKKRIVARCMDALRMERYSDGCIDKIVCDPPWGIYRKLSLEPTEFLRRMLAEFDRVLKPNGLAVILITRELPFQSVLAAAGTRLTVQNRFDILLSGKKTSIYRLSKTDIECKLQHGAAPHSRH
jgi:tRNA (guanine6-N2)-methyltransferase